MARPKTVITTEQIKAIYKLAKAGCSDHEIAKAIGISYPTFLKNKFEFFDLLKKGREEGLPIHIAAVENALLRKACGFEFTEVTREPHYVHKDGYIAIHEDKEMQVTKTVTKYVVPSDQSIFYYLGNRAPEKWHSVNYAKIEHELGDTAGEYFKQIADALEKSDTATD